MSHLFELLAEALDDDDCYGPEAAHALLSNLPPEAVQAWHDGMALMALREALGEESYPTLEGPTPDLPVWSVFICEALSGVRGVLYEAPTLAAACDKARKALG